MKTQDQLTLRDLQEIVVSEKKISLEGVSYGS
jgi:hypothetical protein